MMDQRKLLPNIVSCCFGIASLGMGAWASWSSAWVKTPSLERGLFRQCAVSINGTFNCRKVPSESWLLAVQILFLGMLIASFAALCLLLVQFKVDVTKLRRMAVGCYATAGLLGIIACVCFTALKELAALTSLGYGGGFIVAWLGAVLAPISAAPLVWSMTRAEGSNEVQPDTKQDQERNE